MRNLDTLRRMTKRAVKAGQAMLVEVGAVTHNESLFTSIHAEPEVARKLEAMRDTDSRLMKLGKKQGYTMDLAKYGDMVYATGKMQSDLASENDSFHAMRQLAMVGAAENTRNLAGGLHSRE